MIPVGVAELGRRLGVDVSAREGQRQMVHRQPTQLALDALGLGVADVQDRGDAVQALYAQLNVVPFLPEDGAVEAERVLSPGGLPAQFIVGQLVRRVRNDSDAAIVAAWPVAGRIGGVHHALGVELVLQVDPMGFAVVRHSLVGVDAGPARIVRRGRKASWLRRCVNRLLYPKKPNSVLSTQK